MESPHLEVYEERELLGSGSSGAVFRAVRSDGEVRAVKMLDGMAIHRGLLERSVERLEQGGWPKGVLEVIEADFRARPAARVTRCLADEMGGCWQPRSLQHLLAEHPGPDSWGVVLGIIGALAGMHDRRVAHGNLKPGNVFLDDDGGVLLSDWALGHMPGVAHLEYTDACLYQPPEQLRSPEGYLEEEGYRWDVFAFGVLAHRLLTGAFPRCDATFQQVAPEPGKTSREGIAADLLKIAQSLEGQPKFEWPEEASDTLERLYRETIDQCLALNPADRPANAMEVSRMFGEAELLVDQEDKRETLLDQRRHAGRVAMRASIAAGLMAAAVVVLSLLWQLANSQLDNEMRGREREVKVLSEQMEEANVARQEAELARNEAQQILRTEEATWLARLQQSRQIGDKLFSWAMEKGNRELPPLDGREHRLARLDEYFTGFLERTAKVPGLDEERAMVRLQLAEISLAAGDPAKAVERLERAMEHVDKLGGGGELDLRLAEDRLMLALLWQARNDPKTDEAMTAARRALEAVPLSEVDEDRVMRALCVLDIHQSRQLAAKADEAKALELLHRATERLNELADQRPEISILRSELVSCYLSSATILDGMGELGDARTVRKLAADELMELIEERPGDLQLQIELAGCYGSIAEAAVLAGDLGNAEAYSNAAVKLLANLLPQRPDSAVVRSRLAAQRGLMAGIQRDRGESEEAMNLYNEGLRLLEGLTVGEKADPVARYRYALLTWEKGRMLGFSGEREKEISLTQEAAAMMEDLLETSYGVARGEQIRRSLGYMLGDLGHAAQLAGNKKLSVDSFTRAVRTWEALSRSRPSSEEYEEALAWNRQRLEDLP